MSTAIKDHKIATRFLVTLALIPAVTAVALWMPFPPGITPGGGVDSAATPNGGVQSAGSPDAPPGVVNGSTVTVAVEQTGDSHLETATKQAVAYWNSSGQQYLPVKVRVRYVRGAPADVIVNGTRAQLPCNGATSGPVVGCAHPRPLMTAGSENATVDIRLGGPAAALRPTVKHELGHILGLSHDDEPARLMGNDGVLTKQQLAEIEVLSEHQIERGVRTDLPGEAEDDPALRSAAREHSRAMAKRGFVKAEGWGITAVDDRINRGCGPEEDDQSQAIVTRTFAYRFVAVRSADDHTELEDGRQTREEYHDSERDLFETIADQVTDQIQDVRLNESSTRKSVGVYITKVGEVYVTAVYC